MRPASGFALLVFLLPCFSDPALAGSEASTRAGEIFAKVEARFESLESLGYRVSRSITSGRRTVEDSWRFVWRSPDFLRITHRQQYEKIITVGNGVYLENIPVARRALRADLAAMDEDRRGAYLAGIISRVAVEGLRLGDYGELVRSVRTVAEETYQGRPVWRVEGDGARYLLLIDRERLLVLRWDLSGEDGTVRSRVEVERVSEVAKGFWFPLVVESVHAGKEGQVKVRCVISDVAVNPRLPDSLFVQQLPQETTVETVVE